MEPNVKVFRAHRAISWLYLVVMVLMGTVFLMDRDLLALVAAELVLGAVFLLHHYTAKGARECKPWAKVTSTIIAVLMLFGFPIGTLIGIYLLYNTSQAWEPAAA